MADRTSKAKAAWLLPLAGPPIDAIELNPSPAGVTVGRQEQCDVRLPAEAEAVSRFHVRFNGDESGWRLTDLKSRWGTFVNGMAAPPGREVPLSEGDLIRITPWTFTFSYSSAARPGVDSVNDSETMQTLVRSLPPTHRETLAEDMLNVLLEAAANIHAATDEKALGELILQAATRGTGLPNAALLRPVDSAGRVEVIASKRASQAFADGPLYSRSLLAAAAGGAVAEFSDAGEADLSKSIVQMKVNAAMCVPLMLGSTVAAYIYLDTRGEPRGSRATQPRKGGAAFCMALGRIAGLALANLKRVDIERRQASMLAELSAGAEAQRWILPKRQATYGRFTYTGESRPGRHVGGDFFDVISISDQRLIVAMGDVTGKGIPASVLMTATQGFLHAALQDHGDVARAVNELNRFVSPRRPEGRFVTLWVGLFDLEAGTVSYVDAGHGYAMLAFPGVPGNASQDLRGEEGLPIGLDTDAAYRPTTVPLRKGWRAVVVSDGIVEQPAGVATIDARGKPSRSQFGMEGVNRCLASCGESADVVAALFAEVIQHAGSDALADDATAVLLCAE